MIAQRQTTENDHCTHLWSNAPLHYGYPKLICRKCHLLILRSNSIGYIGACRACGASFTIEANVLAFNHSKNVLCFNCAQKLRIIMYYYNEMLCAGAEMGRKPRQMPYERKEV
jgi:hypothetical protein